MSTELTLLGTELHDSGLVEIKTVAQRAEFREKIEQLQALMVAEIPLHLQDEFMDSCVLSHHFSNGVYVRQIFLPAKSFIIGKIHKKSHMNIISSGRCIVRTEKFGSVIYDASTAPLTFESEKGTKRVLWVEEDTYWTTIHPTSCTTIEAVEAEIFEIFYSDFVRDNPEFSLTLLEVEAA